MDHESQKLAEGRIFEINFSLKEVADGAKSNLLI